LSRRASPGTRRARAGRDYDTARVGNCGGRVSGGGPRMIKIARFATENLNGFMDEGASVLGELRFNDVFRIDGRLKGRVVSDSTLIVGETGEIEAEIDCRIVSIRGKVTGRVRGRERIELLGGAEVRATLIAPKLVIEDGAFFIGECEMVPSTPQPPKSLPAGRADASAAADKKGTAR